MLWGISLLERALQHVSQTDCPCIVAGWVLRAMVVSPAELTEFTWNVSVTWNGGKHVGYSPDWDGDAGTDCVNWTESGGPSAACVKTASQTVTDIVTLARASLSRGQ